MSLRRSLVTQDDGRPRFSKYMPTDRKFVNYVCNYPYPYVISRLCWELPLTLPDDWQGFHLQGANSPATVNDMKAGIDATVLKQGVYVLTFHPHVWIQNEDTGEDAVFDGRPTRIPTEGRSYATLLNSGVPTPAKRSGTK